CSICSTRRALANAAAQLGHVVRCAATRPSGVSSPAAIGSIASRTSSQNMITGLWPGPGTLNSTLPKIGFQQPPKLLLCTVKLRLHRPERQLECLGEILVLHAL